MPVLAVLLATASQDLPARLKADAMDARQQLAVVWVKVGDAFRKVGTGVKEGGVAVGHGAKAVGRDVGHGAGQVGQAVKKRAKRFGQGVKEAFSPDS